MGDMNNLTLRNEVGASLQMSMLLGWSLMTVSDSDGETTAGFIVDPRGKSIAYGINVPELFERMMLKVPPRQASGSPELGDEAIDGKGLAP